MKGHEAKYSGLLPLWMLLFAALMFAVSPVRAAGERPSPEQAKAFLSDLANHAAMVLEKNDEPLAKREAALRDLLKGSFEIPLIARIALGKHWRRTPKSDRAVYTEVFGEFLLRTYGNKLAAFDRDTFEVVGAVPRGKRDVVVQTRILQENGPPIKAGWRVRLFQGEPRIIDIVIEGVSMALNQRQEFAAVLTKGGLGGLMEMLRARTQRLPVEGPRTAAAG